MRVRGRGRGGVAGRSGRRVVAVIVSIPCIGASVTGVVTPVGVVPVSSMLPVPGMPSVSGMAPMTGVRGAAKRDPIERRSL